MRFEDIFTNESTFKVTRELNFSTYITNITIWEQTSPNHKPRIHCDIRITLDEDIHLYHTTVNHFTQLKQGGLAILGPTTVYQSRTSNNGTFSEFHKAISSDAENYCSKINETIKFTDYSAYVIANDILLITSDLIGRLMLELEKASSIF